MEKNRICKICNRRFANGKAMGGHMRSHLAKLPLPPKPIVQQVQSPSPIKLPSPSPSSSSSLNYPYNRMQSYRSVNHELPFRSSKPNLSVTATVNDVNDDGSDTDSMRNNNPTGRRSKRRRKSIEKVVESSPEHVSWITHDFLNEEDVALCLLMLSEDRRAWEYMKKKFKHDSEPEPENEGEGGDEDEDDESFDVIPIRSKAKTKYKCQTCKKVFRSYQALGGHKASHKKIKTTQEYEECSWGGGGAGGGASARNCDPVLEHRVFKCPFCEKVFDSGQALGGHKKVHFSYLGDPKVLAKSSDTLLDLNLPAPQDEDDGELDQAQSYYLRN
ncbi:zinc finger protein ZAT9 [Mercurialis annua]|uniref:zinc finger protein ZAT9 n=1 Tax=Mercurialis annua TaxID=3986 RepID=UPI00216039DD|nr:zinc finger protein ZAT9 [Mercurialis annua]